MPAFHDLSPLLELLAGLYPTPQDAQRVATLAQIPLEFVELQGPANQIWTSILSQAQQRDRLAHLVAIARREYPERSTEIKRAYDSAGPGVSKMHTHWDFPDDGARSSIGRALWALLIVGLVLVVGVFLLIINSGPNAQWREVTTAISAQRHPLFNEGERVGNLAIVRADQNLVDVSAAYLRDGVNLTEQIHDQQAIAAINGPSFGESRDAGPIGLVVAKGKAYRAELNPDWSACFLSRCEEETSWISWIGYCRDSPVQDWETCQTALQGQLILVEPDGTNGIGKRSTDKLAARSGICLGSGTYIYLIGTELFAEHAGIPLYDFAELLSGPKQIVPCRVAMLLDGGRATAMALRESPKKQTLRWSFGPAQGSDDSLDQWRTPVALFLRPK